MFTCPVVALATGTHTMHLSDERTALASAVLLGSESLWSRDHISLPQI
jgi:hypothetical protein